MHLIETGEKVLYGVNADKTTRASCLHYPTLGSYLKIHVRFHITCYFVSLILTKCLQVSDISSHTT